MPSLTLPYGCFFDSEHATVELRAQEFAARAESRGSIRDRVRALGHAGLLQNIGKGDVRSLAVTRGALSYQDALDDLAFVIQELGGFPLAKTDTEGSVLEAARRGEAVLCFAMTEPDAGSDLAGMTTIAEPDGHHWRLTGIKHYISNAPEADHAVVFAKVGAGGDAKSAGRIAAFFVENPTTEAQSVSGMKPILTSFFSGASEPCAYTVARSAGVMPMAPTVAACSTERRVREDFSSSVMSNTPEVKNKKSNRKNKKGARTKQAQCCVAGYERLCSGDSPLRR